MKETRLLMGMPITVEIVDKQVEKADIEKIYLFFESVDARFSTYKSDSEISHINAQLVNPEDYSRDMREVFQLAEKTKKQTNGFFDIQHKGSIDPSGIVKGWAIAKAAKQLEKDGFTHFYIDAGGDIQTHGRNDIDENWKIGIRNPFKRDEHVKVVSGTNIAVATSGTAIRGQHIYNPFDPKRKIIDIVSFTVIGDNILDADRFATAAFAMGKSGITFLEKLTSFEGYVIDKDGIATYTSGFENYVV